MKTATIENEDSDEILTMINVRADDGAEQIFSRHDLGLDESKGYTRKEWLKALERKGYSRLGVVSID